MRIGIAPSPLDLESHVESVTGPGARHSASTTDTIASARSDARTSSRGSECRAAHRHGGGCRQDASSPLLLNGSDLLCEHGDGRGALLVEIARRRIE